MACDSSLDIPCTRCCALRLCEAVAQFRSQPLALHPQTPHEVLALLLPEFARSSRLRTPREQAEKLSIWSPDREFRLHM
eukprot:4788310-Amphidinium_carterae.1